MARVYGMHMIGLRPGVKGEDFEKFFREKVVTMPTPTGWKVSLLRGDRGDRVGKYLVLIEIESEEARARFAPTPDQTAEEITDELQAVFDEWGQYASSIGAPTIYTDYVVVAG